MTVVMWFRPGRPGEDHGALAAAGGRPVVPLFVLDPVRQRSAAGIRGLAAWCNGRTGYPFVDAGMRQLLAEGWMHNRARLVTAPFLTKDLLVDWHRGAEWFLQHLIDGDVANNNLGWQWAAGTGMDPAPFHRVFNPVLQGAVCVHISASSRDPA